MNNPRPALILAMPILGGALAGVVGLIRAIPVTVTVQRLVRTLVWDQEVQNAQGSPKSSTPIEGSR